MENRTQNGLWNLCGSSGLFTTPILFLNGDFRLKFKLLFNIKRFQFLRLCLPTYITFNHFTFDFRYLCEKSSQQSNAHCTSHIQHFKVQPACIEIDVFWAAELGKSLSKICVWQLLLLFKRMFALQEDEGFLDLTGPFTH